MKVLHSNVAPTYNSPRRTGRFVESENDGETISELPIYKNDEKVISDGAIIDDVNINYDDEKEDDLAVK